MLSQLNTTGSAGRTLLPRTDFSNSSIPADNGPNSFRNTTSLLPQTEAGATGRIGGPANLFGPDRELQARTGASGWFSIDSYAGYFDVETKMVLERCWKTMFPKDEYLEGVLGGQPDLYGELVFRGR